MKIAVIGTGYVGLVTATCLAESGNEVVGIDKDAAKIATLEDGRLPIYEPGLLELVQRNRREQRLTFTTDLAAGVKDAQLIFIAVGTPQSASGAADLVRLWAVGDALATAVRRRCRRRHQEHRPGRHQSPAHRTHGGQGGADRRRQQSRVPQGRGRHRRLHEARSRRRRRPHAEVPRSCFRSSTARSCAPNGRSWSCRPKARR